MRRTTCWRTEPMITDGVALNNHSHTTRLVMFCPRPTHGERHCQESAMTASSAAASISVVRDCAASRMSRCRKSSSAASQFLDGLAPSPVPVRGRWMVRSGEEAAQFLENVHGARPVQRSCECVVCQSIADDRRARTMPSSDRSSPAPVPDRAHRRPRSQ
jgi:hypothetical protein